jgi:hypothetical protein
MRLLSTLSKSAGIIINSLGVPARLVDGDKNGLKAGLNAANAYKNKTIHFFLPLEFFEKKLRSVTHVGYMCS